MQRPPWGNEGPPPVRATSARPRPGPVVTRRPTTVWPNGALAPRRHRLPRPQGKKAGCHYCRRRAERPDRRPAGHLSGPTRPRRDVLRGGSGHPGPARGWPSSQPRNKSMPRFRRGEPGAGEGSPPTTSARWCLVDSEGVDEKAAASRVHPPQSRPPSSLIRPATRRTPSRVKLRRGCRSAVSSNISPKLVAAHAVHVPKRLSPARSEAMAAIAAKFRIRPI